MGIEDKKNALEIALEFIKQIITLTSGVLAISIAFLSSQKCLTILDIVLISLSWVALLASLVFGINTISMMVKSQLDEKVDWSTGICQLFATVCKWLFVAGLVFLMLFSFFVLIGK